MLDYKRVPHNVDLSLTAQLIDLDEGSSRIGMPVLKSLLETVKSIS